MTDNFPSPKAIETLQLELSLLRILHHRNKNQHHLQPFFKHLSILKRILSLLLSHVESSYLLQRLRTIVVPKAWEEFSRVVARGEFVTLGLVLCGCVSRIGYCIGGIESEHVGPAIEGDDGVIQGNDEVGEVVMRDSFPEDSMALDGFVGESEVEVTSASQLTPSGTREGETQYQEEIVDAKSTKVPMPPSEKHAIGEIPPPAKKRRKRGRQDDIDKLFAGLD
jgi:ribonuclease MRP protein subunit RMP1